MTSTVLVTGSSGYIGGQTALKLKDAGYTVVGLDRRPPPEHLKSAVDHWCIADFASVVALEFIELHKPTAIIHCAGASLVGPSIQKPSDYYHNNVVKTLHLLDFILYAMPTTKFIFSSSAATYGNPIMVPCQEMDPCDPISPYGESKLMIEWFLRAYHTAYGLNYVAFRYFNACGADSQGRHGQEPGATHLIARVLESIRDHTDFTLYGTDHPTEDGTCVRDYVHVEDIARAHVISISENIPTGIYNLGSNQGYSNRDVMAAAQVITNKELSVFESSARPGDPPILTASDDKFKEHIGEWRHFNLDEMIAHAWAWYNK
jgi:UDP-glucose 4-epimerase